MAAVSVCLAYSRFRNTTVGVTLKGIEATNETMERDTGEPPPSLGLVIILIATPIVLGGSLFFLFDTGPIHRLGLYLIGAGVLVGGIIFLWRRM